MTPLVEAAPPQSRSPAGRPVPIGPFPDAEGGALGLPHRSALVDGGSPSCKPAVEARRDVATGRLDDLSGGAAGALFAGVALLTAAALLLALVVPWLSPLERRTP